MNASTLAIHRLSGFVLGWTLLSPNLAPPTLAAEVRSPSEVSPANIAMLEEPYAPLMAVIGGGCMGPFSDAQIRQIAETWQMVNSHGGMLRHDDISEGMMAFWAGPSCGVDEDGRTIGDRIKGINPDFTLSNYRNGSYISQFCPEEAEEVESRLPLGISVWNTGTRLLQAVAPDHTTIQISRYPEERVPSEPAISEGRPAAYPFKASTTAEEHSQSTKQYVAWIRIGDEILRIDEITVQPQALQLTVRRGIWGTTAARHAEGSAVFQPIYIGRNRGIDGPDHSLGGRPDDRSSQPGLRYALMTFHPEMHRWLGEKAKVIFDQGYDVCWLDVSVSTWYNNANAYGDDARPWNLRKNEPLTQDDYRAWQQEKNDALYALFPDKQFWINNVKGSVYFSNGNERYQLSGENGYHPVDGGSMEMYANHGGNEFAWTQTVNMTLDMVQSGFKGVAWSKGQNNMAYRRFSYATYLLAYEAGVPLYFAIGEGGGLLNRPSDLFYYDLGKPQETFRSVDEARLEGMDGLYGRAFTNGRVIVNPGSESRKIDLGRTYIDSENGKLVRELELPGNRAVILIASPSSQAKK